MTIAEMVILMVVGTICIVAGIIVVYHFIAKTVEWFSINKERRARQEWEKFLNELPKAIKSIANVAKEMMIEEDSRRYERMKIRTQKEDE